MSEDTPDKHDEQNVDEDEDGDEENGSCDEVSEEEQEELSEVSERLKSLTRTATGVMKNLQSSVRSCESTWTRVKTGLSDVQDAVAGESVDEKSRGTTS